MDVPGLATPAVDPRGIDVGPGPIGWQGLAGPRRCGVRAPSIIQAVHTADPRPSTETGFAFMDMGSVVAWDGS